MKINNLHEGFNLQQFESKQPTNHLLNNTDDIVYFYDGKPLYIDFLLETEFFEVMKPLLTSKKCKYYFYYFRAST